jgi:hypothetical protein
MTTTINTAATNYTYTRWEDLSELEQMESRYSDFFKEAYGYRPRHDTTEWTVEDYKREFDRLREICDENEVAKQESQTRCIASFEALVAKLIQDNGAPDRATAIRWLADAEGVGEDMEFLCYLLG